MKLLIAILFVLIGIGITLYAVWNISFKAAVVGSIFSFIGVIIWYFEARKEE